MGLTLQQLQELRRNRNVEANNLVSLQNIQTKIGADLLTAKPTDLPTGADKVNQLILEQSAKLQTLAAEQVNRLASEFGITGINSTDPTLTVPSPGLNPKDIQLPEIPPEITSPVPKLTLRPVEVKISDIDTVPALLQQQFIDQLKPVEYERLSEEDKKQVLLTLTPVTLQLATQLFSKKPPYCPTDGRLEVIIKIFNNLIDVLETTATVLNYTAASLNILTQVLNGAITAKGAIEIAKIAANQVIKALPLVPGPIASVMTDLEDILKTLTYKADGTSKLEDRQEQLKTGAFYISLASITVNGIVLVLKLLRPALKQCGLEPKELGPEITKFIAQAQITNQSDTKQSYRGFTFEIVEVKLPNDPTVTRRIGQALNTEGVIALETKPSFTQNPKVLIEELKLIIDRDNLKAF